MLAAKDTQRQTFKHQQAFFCNETGTKTDKEVCFAKAIIFFTYILESN